MVNVSCIAGKGKGKKMGYPNVGGMGAATNWLTIKKQGIS
jgi:hypothetical protein